MAAPTFDQFAAKAASLYPDATEAQIREAYQAKYDRTPVRTQGPKRDEFAARARQLYPDATDSQIDEAYEAKYGSSLGEDYARAAKRGFASFGDIVGAGLGAVGADDLGGSIRDYWRNVQESNAQSVEMQNRAWYNPAKILDATIEAGVGMAPQVGLGGGTTALLTRLGLGAKAALAGGAAAGAGVGAAQEAVPFYEELQKAGDPNAGLKAAGLGAYVAATGAIPLSRILGREPGRLATGAWEAGTEISEEPVQALLSGKDPIAATIEGAKAVGPAAFLLGAGLGAGPLRNRDTQTDADRFKEQAGLEAPPVAADTPSPEPLRDIQAQIQEVGQSRRGVYLAPGQGEVDPGPLTAVPTPDGGRMLVAEEDAPELAQALEGADEAGRQAVIGQWTGAGVGKPLDPDAVVVQAIKGGAVVRETIVPKAEAEATRKRFEKELKTQARVVSGKEAVARRQRIIENEDRSPFLEMGQEELLRRTDPRGFLKGVVDQRGLPRREELPPEPERYFEQTPDSALVPIENLVRTKPQEASSAANGLKRMAAAAKGEIGKRPPISVRVDGQGRMNVVDGNGSLAAAKYARLPAIPADIELETTTPQAKAYERRLSPEARRDLAALARDAQAFMPQFEAALEGIAESITGTRRSQNKGLGALVPPIKSHGGKKWDRVVEKIVAEEAGDHTTLKDMARATILVANREQAQAAVAALEQKFGRAPGTKLRRTMLDAQNFDEVVKSDPYGYADVKINIQGPNGRVYEVQITTPELFIAKEGQGHKIYDKGRELEGKMRDSLAKIVGRRLGAGDPENIKRAISRAMDMFRDRDPKMQAFYKASREVYGPAWAAFEASSRQAASQASSEMGSPSSRTEEGVTGRNVPDESAFNASNSQMMAGLSPTMKNSNLALTGDSSATGDSVASDRASYKIATPSGYEFDARLEVADLDALVASDDPRFPAELQPRDRGTRAALSEQVEKIAARLDPRRLGQWFSTEEGAPIVSAQGVVESGNGRTFALRLAREKYPERWRAYQEWIREYAREKGLSIEGIANPVIVQVRTSPMSQADLKAYTGDANEEGKAAFSAAEKARKDAGLLDAGLLTTLKSGDLTQAQNTEFLLGFIGRLPPTAVNNLVDATGKVSIEGIRRAEAALIAKAYGGGPEVGPLLERLYESGHDENVRRITNALKAAAYRMAQLRESVESGNVAAEYDIGRDVVLAYNAIREGRSRGQALADIVKQTDLLGGRVRELVMQKFVKADGKTEQTQDRIANQLIYYAQEAQRQSLSQGSMFGDTVAPTEILEAAVRDIGHNEAAAPAFAARGMVGNKGTDPWKIHQAILPVLDRWDPDSAPDVRIVQHAGELPAHILQALGPEIDGAADVDNGVVYLVAENIKSIWHAERVLAHEAVGHYGMMRLYGERWGSLMEQVNRLAETDKDVRRIAARVDHVYRDQNLDADTRAAEIVAHLAEEKPEHNFARKIIAQFREILRMIGFRVNLSKNDLIYLLRRAADAMVDRRGPAYLRRGGSTPVIRRGTSAARPFVARKVEGVYDKNLIAQHNLSVENLEYVLDRYNGRIPVPSIAITKKDTPLDGFGEITLLGDANLVDPRGEHRTRVFGADIYSPRYPSNIETKFKIPKDKALEKAREIVANVEFDARLPSSSHWRYRLTDAIKSGVNQETATGILADSVESYLAVARDAGVKDPASLYRQAATIAREEALRRFGEGGAPAEALKIPAVRDDYDRALLDEVRGQVRAATGLSDAELWSRATSRAREIVGRLGIKKRIVTGYDDYGNRRYTAYTLDSVIRLMKRGLRGGETGGASLYGAGPIRAQVTPRFSSRKQITANKWRLMDKRTFDKEANRANEMLDRIAVDFFNGRGSGDGGFSTGLATAADYVYEFARGKRLKELVAPGVDQDALDARVREFLATMRDMPTQYFEAKILGPVALEQFKAAVVPDSLSPHTRAILESRGLQLFTYTRGMGSNNMRAAVVRAAAEKMDLVFASRRGAKYRSGQVDWLAPEYQEQLERLETRPGTTQTQIDTGFYALRDLFTEEDMRAGAEVRGLSVPRDFVSQGTTSLMGQKIETPHDLAILGRVYRDPRFETLRIFLTRGGEVVQEFGLSARMPGMVAWRTEKNDADGLVARLAEKFKAHQADGWFALHNHPTGRAEPSEGDVGWTTFYAEKLRDRGVPVSAFKGHVIIDRTEYSVIELKTSNFGKSINAVSQEFEVPRDKQDGYITSSESRPIEIQERATVPHAELGMRHSQTLAKLAMRVYDPKAQANKVTVVGTDYEGRVCVICDMPISFIAIRAKTGQFDSFKAHVEKLDERLGRIVENSGARALNLVAPNQLEGGAFDLAPAVRSRFANVVRVDAAGSPVVVPASPSQAGLDRGKVAYRGDSAAQNFPSTRVAQTDPFGRPKDEKGRTLDWNGNVIPEGQQELPGFDETVRQLEREFIGRDDDFWGIENRGDEAKFKDSNFDAATCTGYACAIRDKLGDDRVLVAGFSIYGNPSATRMGEVADGHDFAVVDGRYIVDPWVVDVESIASKGVFDLNNPADLNEISALYGDPRKWQLVPPRGERDYNTIKREDRFDDLKRNAANALKPPLSLERPQGSVGAGPSRAPQMTGQRGLFASRSKSPITREAADFWIKDSGSAERAMIELAQEIDRGNAVSTLKPVMAAVRERLGSKYREALKKNAEAADYWIREAGSIERAIVELDEEVRRGNKELHPVLRAVLAKARRPSGMFASRPQPPVQTRVQVGGGDYSLAQFGRLTPQEQNVLVSVMDTLEEPVAAQRRGTRDWSTTERAALQKIQNQFGITLDSLVNRKPGSAANAEQLEAYGIIINAATARVKEIADEVALSRNPSSEQIARLADAREKLGMLLAPAMGYRTEAGRALNILRKQAADMRDADAILEALGDGTEETLKDFAHRVRRAGSADQVIGLTRASYTPTWWDKFYEYWINGLLSGPTTHSVNIVSNGLFGVLESAAEVAAAATTDKIPMRSAAARVAALPHGVSLGLKNAAIAFEEERAVLTPEDKLEKDMRAIGGTLGRIVRLPGRALQAEDEMFKAIAYQGALSALAMDEAVRKNPQDPMAEHARIMGSILSRPELIKAAKEHAARVTFTTPLGPIGAAVTNVLNRSKVGRLIVPFVRTPVNILKRALEYTPAAPLFEQVRADLSGGGRNQAMAWSRMAVGSSVMLGVVGLVMQGVLSGAGPDDQDERAQLMRQGWRPYSVKVGDQWVRYNRFEPFGMLMGLGADMAELYGAMGTEEWNTVASMLVTSLATNLGDKTFLRGITEFSAAYSDPQRYMERWVHSMASSPVPNIAGQTARWLDPYQRETSSILDAIRAKIPGMTEDMAKRLDIAGEPIKRDTGVPGNPFQAAQQRQDVLARAMLDLGVKKNAVSRTLQVGGRSYELQGEDYESFKGYVQKARWNVLTPLVSSPQFRALQAQNPLAAQALLEKQYEEIGRQARIAWIMQNARILGDPKKAQRSPTALGYDLR